MPPESEFVKYKLEMVSPGLGQGKNQQVRDFEFLNFPCKKVYACEKGKIINYFENKQEKSFASSGTRQKSVFELSTGVC